MSIENILILVVGFVLSVGAAIFGAYFQRKLDERRETRPLSQLLNFGKDDLYFIYPHRNDFGNNTVRKDTSILPRTSTEDFMAVNNFISALINRRWDRKLCFHDTTHVSGEDKKKNLVIICSPKSNGFAALYQKEINEKHYFDHFYEFKQDNRGEWYITDGHGIWTSPSFTMETEYLKNGINRDGFASQSFEDYAVITKTRNPWNEKNKIISVAGIRGFGTWGAAECVKKEWRQIFKKLPRNCKEEGFSALVNIKYDNFDITSIELIEIIYIAKHQEN